MFKRMIGLTAILMTVFFVGCGQTSSSVSGDEDTDVSQMGASLSLALTIANDDSPIVSYTNTSGGYNIFVRKYSGGNMLAYGINPVSDGVGYFAKTIMAPDSSLYLAYKDGAINYKASVKRYFLGSWNYLGGAGISSGKANYTCVAVDSTGVAYVAYVEATDDSDSGGLLVVKKYDGTNWVAVGTNPLTAGKAYYVSLAIDPSTNDPYVAYVDYGRGMRVVVKHFDGTNWEVSGVEGLSSTSSRYSSLAISSTGNTFVAYEDGARETKETVKNFDAAIWVTAGSSLGFSEGEGRYTSLAISPTGSPIVAYVDQSKGAKVCVMTLVAGSWQYLGLPAFSPAQASWTDIKFDSTGAPYVACRVGDSFITYLYKFNGTNWEQLASDF